MTIVGFLGAFNGLGFSQAAVRFVAAYSATAKMKLLGGFLARSLVMLLVSDLLVVAAMLAAGRWIAVRIYHTPELSRYIGSFALIVAFGTINAFLGQVLAGYKDVTKRTVITNFIATPAMMIITFIFITWGLGLRGYLIAQILAAVLTTCLLLMVAWKLTPHTARLLGLWKQPFERQVVAFSIASLGMIFLQFAISQTDKIMIGIYLNARDAGVYVVAMGLVALVPSVLQAVNQIFGPTIAELHARADHQLLARIFQTLTKWILGLTLPLIFMLLVFAHPMMRIFGRDFEWGWPVLMIGALGELFDCGVGSVGFLLLMSGNERRLLRIQIVMVALTVGLNILLIPRFGIVGAAVASAVTTAGSNLWSLREVHHALGIFPYNRSYGRMLVPVAASFSVLWLARFSLAFFRPLAVVGGSLVLAYVVFVTVALSFGLDPDDKLVVHAVWARLRAVVPGAR